MRFESISIVNYRQYKNLKIEFKKNSENDLHLIIASNGVGKTNLLNAINWCLYGDEPHLDKDSRALPICNLESITDAKESGSTDCQVSVCITCSDKDDTIIFNRSSRVSISAPQFEREPVFIVQRYRLTGTQTFEGPDAISIVDSYMPKKIREYFYFDGERLENYFSKSRNTVSIKDSIYEIAQVNVVTETKKQVKSLITDYQREIGKRSPNIEAINKELDDLNKQLEEKDNEIFNIIKQNGLASDEIEECNKFLNGQENLEEQNNRYSQLEQQRKDLIGSLGEKEVELRSFLRKYYILLNLYPYADKVLSYIEDRTDRGELPPKVDTKSLTKILEEGSCSLCGSIIDESARDRIKELIAQGNISSKAAFFLSEIKSGLENSVISVEGYKEDGTALFDTIRKKHDLLSAVSEEMSRLYKTISDCSNLKEIIQKSNDRNRYKAAIDTNTKKLGQLELVVEELAAKINKKEQERENSIASIEMCEVTKGYMQQAALMYDYLDKIEQEMIDEVRSKLEETTMRYFDSFVWKKETYSHIILDEQYRFELFHVDGFSCLGSCSAAEKALLALSFTLALHKVSVYDSLLLIDTPVSRVSDKNRVNFAEVLVEVSKSKEMIFLFTPSEYSAEIKNIFDSKASSVMKLETYDERKTEMEVY